MSRWRTAARAADLRELPLVAALAALLVADALYRAEGDFTFAAVGALALTTVPLLWRRRAPLVALVAVVAGVFACLATVQPHDVIVLPVIICAYSVAVTGHRLRSAITAAFVVAAAVGAIAPYLDEGASWKDVVLNAVVLVLAVVTGDLVRTRRAYGEATLAREAERERNQRAEAQQMVAQERLRIAQDVHDVVAHSMVAINVQAGVAAHVLDRDPAQARTALRIIKETSGTALTDLARTLGVLRDDGDAAPLRPTQALSGIDELAVVLRGAGIDVEVTVSGGEDRVSAAVGAAAFRIAQEACTNILRHAGARTATIKVQVGEDAVDVSVEDDGAALTPVGGPVEAGSGNGLRGMTERATTLGGRLDAGRRPEGGWHVHAVLPL